MPGDSSQKSAKTIQTLITSKKQEKSPNQGKPAKRDKRTHSDVAEESIDRVDMDSLHADLIEIKSALESTVTKSDLDNALDTLVKQSDLKDIVSEIVSQMLTVFKETITMDLNEKLKERTGKMQDHIDNLYLENNNLKERLREKEKQIQNLEENVNDSKSRAVEALKLGNFNEQYSRKNNMRVLNLPEKKDENLRNEFINIVKTDLEINIEQSDVIAIHRLPGKEGLIKPAIVKVRNNEIKKQIMRKKKELKNNVRFHDDITQRNLGLLSRLKQSNKLESAWFYNCSVYGKQTATSNRIKFDLFDNIDLKLRK